MLQHLHKVNFGYNFFCLVQGTSKDEIALPIHNEVLMTKILIKETI